MDIKGVIKAYKNLITQPEILRKGKKYLESLLKVEKNFSFKSCQILVSKKVDQKFRFYQGILLKNILVDNWESDPGIMSHQKVCHVFVKAYIVM